MCLKSHRKDGSTRERRSRDKHQGQFSGVNGGIQGQTTFTKRVNDGLKMWAMFFVSQNVCNTEQCIFST